MEIVSRFLEIPFYFIKFSKPFQYCHISPVFQLSNMPWEWLGAGKWQPYDEKAQKIITKAYKKQANSVEIAIATGDLYLIDLVNLRQIKNGFPNKTRQVRWNDGTLPTTLPPRKKNHSTTTTTIVSTLIYH